MFVFVLLCITLCPFLFCNYLEEGKKAGCFAIDVLQMYCYYKCYVALHHGVWGCLQYVIVVFPDHTYLILCQEVFFNFSQTFTTLRLIKKNVCFNHTNSRSQSQVNNLKFDFMFVRSLV